jgi:hypothetical protein
MSDPAPSLICPNGHTSSDRGYCTVCGTTMAPLAHPDSAPTTLVPPGSFRSRGGFAPPATVSCPHCSAQIDESSRFCEVCGYDPETGSLPEAPAVLPAPAEPSLRGSSSGPDLYRAAGGSSGPASVGLGPDPYGAPPSSSSAPPPSPPSASSGSPSSPALGSSAAFPGGSTDSGPASAPSRRTSAPAAGPWASAPQAPSGASALTLVAVITADRPYYESHYVSEVDFPLGAPARTIELPAAPVHIGRRSRSRGTDPGIDLAGPPEDSAVSHTHASLLPTPDGAWELVDHGSTNGTYVNESPEPLAPNQPRSVGPGDRIYVGAWTRITLEPRAYR